MFQVISFFKNNSIFLFQNLVELLETAFNESSLYYENIADELRTYFNEFIMDFEIKRKIYSNSLVHVSNDRR